MSTFEQHRESDRSAAHGANGRDERFPADKTGWKKSLEDFAMRGVGWIAAALYTTLGSRAGERVGILMYHRVARRVPGLPAPSHNVEPARFREQIEGLLSRGFTIWPLRRFLDHYESGDRVPPKTIALTFDDGFQTVYTAAFPVLKEFGVPASLFVNTAYLDSDEPFPFDGWGMAVRGRAPEASCLPLATGQCREMAASGLVEIGAHTHTHEDFRGRPNAFRSDLQRSIDIVQERFAPQEMTFAFPYGGTHNGFAGDELVEEARRSRIVCGLTTESALVNPHSDPLRWGRFNVFPWDTSRTLAGKLSGWYGWAPRLRKRLNGTLPPAPSTVAGAAP